MNKFKNVRNIYIQYKWNICNISLYPEQLSSAGKTDFYQIILVENEGLGSSQATTSVALSSIDNSIEEIQ